MADPDQRFARLDPQLAALLAETPAPVASAAPVALAASRAGYAAKWATWNDNAPAMYAAQDVELPGAGGANVRARLSQPTKTSRGLIIFFHGGGWTLGSPETHEDMSRRLALAADASILSVDYRLAPEHCFPAQLDDALAVISAAEGVGLESWTGGGIVLAGDSAGAGIALSALIDRRDSGKPALAGAAFFYGCFTADFTTESFREFGDGALGLSRQRMEGFWTNYLGHPPRGDLGLATPGLADLREMPPIYLHAAGLDCVRDGTPALAARLVAAGNDVKMSIAPGAVHGYLQMSSRLALAREVLAEAGAYLGALLHDGVNYAFEQSTTPERLDLPMPTEAQ